MSQMTEGRQDWRSMPISFPDRPDVCRRSYAKMRCRWSSGRTRKDDLRKAQLEVERYLDSVSCGCVSAFDMENDWPTNPLMDSIRERVRQRIQKAVSERDMVVDEKDVMFQVLFRLTTLPPRSLFEDGGAISECLDRVENDRPWPGIQSVDKEVFDARDLSWSRIDPLIKEQLAIIRDRLRQSPLPLEKILGETGICNGEWILKRSGDTVLAENTCNGDQRAVELREVSEETATNVHRDLHYIHTPRTGTAYGLFVEGCELPFSVESVEPVDREYKKAALLLQGYDPDQCVELTRLYNWPSPPMNTVSIMDKLVFDRFRERGDIEAVSTAVMPTYTLSKSQAAGGVDQPYLAKKPANTFIGTSIGGKTMLEHATKRKRQRRGKEPVQRNHPDFPLLPVVELVHEISSPSIDSSGRLNDAMMALGYGG